MQGTINGIGERVGNANLVTIIADLQLKLGYELLAPEQLARLTETAHLVDELLNRTPNPAQPYVGKHAFAHKAGLHAAGVRADAQTFEHIDPLLVGNDRDVLVSELSGRGTISEKAREAGISADEDFAQRVVDRVKSLEHEGFQFEAADGSFELLMRSEAGVYEPLFRLESWRVTVEQRADGRGDRGHDQDLDRRGALCAHGRGERSGERARQGAARRDRGDSSPSARHRPRQLQGADPRRDQGDRSRYAGLIDASDGQEVWGSIGVSENVIAASWDALVDSLEYGMQVLGGLDARRPAM